MDEHNPYRAPEAPIVDALDAPGVTLPLAGRLARLVASILDTILMLLLAVPLMYFVGYFQFMETDLDLVETIAFETAMTIAVFAAFALSQAFPLYKNGQTWGKVALGIRIVDLEGRKPNFWRLLALRYLPWHVIASIPVAGMILSIVDSLMIFRDDRRCAHDLIAGTRVVVVERPDRP
jgi:uncharacterized RDD family membrane protein YckC